MSEWQPLSMFRKFSLWLSRIWWAQHNARVLADMEWRMILLVEDATGGRMSKAYYTIEAMRAEVQANHAALYDEGYKDGLAEADTQ